jgi:hypothetical protein
LWSSFHHFNAAVAARAIDSQHVLARSLHCKLSKLATYPPLPTMRVKVWLRMLHAVAAQVEFERHILKPGLIFKGKGMIETSRFLSYG